MVDACFYAAPRRRRSFASLRPNLMSLHAFRPGTRATLHHGREVHGGTLDVSKAARAGAGGVRTVVAGNSAAEAAMPQRDTPLNPIHRPPVFPRRCRWQNMPSKAARALRAGTWPAPSSLALHLHHAQRSALASHPTSLSCITPNDPLLHPRGQRLLHIRHVACRLTAAGARE
jgi:hypothetical protein